MECPPDVSGDIFECEADLKNCFYQCGIEGWLSRYFAFSGTVSLDWCSRAGIHTDVDGNRLDSSSSYYPVLTVLPMGFSWSFFVVQQMVLGLCAESGLQTEI